MKNNLMLANSKKQLLKDHLISVATLAKESSKNIILKEGFINNLEEICFLSGLFHDLGKIDPNFQKHLSKQDKNENSDDGAHQGYKELEKRATHNELSWAILTNSKISVFGKDLIDLDKNGHIKYSVLYHHKKLKRDNDKNFESSQGILDSVFEVDYQEIKENLSILIDQLNQEYERQFNSKLDLIINLPDSDNRLSISIPLFKESSRDYIQYNSRNTLVRSILISSDRHISKMNGSSLSLTLLNKRIDQIKDGYLILQKDNNLADSILSSLNDELKFPISERSLKQEAIAEKLSKRKFSVLGGPAGCGKTRIALLKTVKEEPKQIFWVCPRIYICESVFEEIYKDYAPNSKIELFTGEKKLIKTGDHPLRETIKNDIIDEELSGDIVVLTIDQLLSIFSKNGKNQTLPKILNSHFIFDEFHEIFQIPNMVYLLKELLFLLENIEKAKVLLMSATPNPNYLSKIKEDFILERDLVLAEDFHDKDISFSIHGDGFQRTQEDSLIDIYNVVSCAQDDYTNDISKSLLFHSSFTKEDKDQIFASLILCFGKNGIHGIKKRKGDFSNLRSGPIVQASLNISAKKLELIILVQTICLKDWGDVIVLVLEMANFKLLKKMIKALKLI